MTSASTITRSARGRSWHRYITLGMMALAWLAFVRAKLPAEGAFPYAPAMNPDPVPKAARRGPGKNAERMQQTALDRRGKKARGARRKRRSADAGALEHSRSPPPDGAGASRCPPIRPSSAGHGRGGDAESARRLAPVAGRRRRHRPPPAPGLLTAAVVPVAASSGIGVLGRASGAVVGGSAASWKERDTRSAVSWAWRSTAAVPPWWAPRAPRRRRLAGGVRCRARRLRQGAPRAARSPSGSEERSTSADALAAYLLRTPARRPRRPSHLPRPRRSIRPRPPSAMVTPAPTQHRHRHAERNSIRALRPAEVAPPAPSIRRRSGCPASAERGAAAGSSTLATSSAIVPPELLGRAGARHAGARALQIRNRWRRHAHDTAELTPSSLRPTGSALARSRASARAKKASTLPAAGQAIRDALGPDRPGCWRSPRRAGPSRAARR